MCFVRCWLSAFLVNAMLISLSPCNVRPSTISSFISLTNCRIYTASLAACPKAMYSASVVEVETVLCFLLHQDTRPASNLLVGPLLHPIFLVQYSLGSGLEFQYHFFAYDFDGEDPDSTGQNLRTHSWEMRKWKLIWHRRRVILVKNLLSETKKFMSGILPPFFLSGQLLPIISR